MTSPALTRTPAIRQPKGQLMTDYEPADDDCIDGDGDPWPEHDYRGYECQRCGAEAPADDE